MTLRNTARSDKPSHPRRQSRPRLSRGPKPSDRTAPVPSRQLRERKEMQSSPPVASLAPRQNHSAHNGSHAEDPLNGSPQSSPENRAASPMPFDRDKTRTIPVKEAAYRLNKNTDTVYLWLRMGRLRGWQLGGSRCAVLVCEASVEEALACGVGMANRD